MWGHISARVGMVTLIGATIAPVCVAEPEKSDVAFEFRGFQRVLPTTNDLDIAELLSQPFVLPPDTSASSRDNIFCGRAWGRKDGSEFSVNLLQAWTENTSSEAIRTMKHDSLLPFGTSVAGRSPSFTYYGFGDNVINVHDLEDPEITHKADLWHVERYFAFTVHPEQAVLKSCAPTLHSSVSQKADVTASGIRYEEFSHPSLIRGSGRTVRLSWEGEKTKRLPDNWVVISKSRRHNSSTVLVCSISEVDALSYSLPMEENDIWAVHIGVQDIRSTPMIDVRGGGRMILRAPYEVDLRDKAGMAVQWQENKMIGAAPESPRHRSLQLLSARNIFTGEWP